jgi:ATP-dependent RNA helicase DHX29
MAQKKKKKAAVSNPARGFATTSLPSKSKIAAAAYTQQVDSSLANSTSTTGDGGGEGGGEGPQPQPQWVPPTEEELEREELLAVVTSHGQKAKRESQRSVNKCETEKRTYRTSSSSYPLRLDHILGVAHINASNVATSSAGSGLNELSLGERILELARTEYVEQLERSGRTKKTYDRDAERAFLVTAWTLHKTLVGLGFAIARADEAIRAVLGRQGSDKKDLDTLLEELLEWISYFCRPDELLMFLDTGFGIGTSVPKKGET